MSKTKDVEEGGQMKQEILDYVKRFNGGVTFVELERFLGDQALGPWGLNSSHNEMVVYWGGMSSEMIDAVEELLAEMEIMLKPTSILTYLADGGYCRLPLVKGTYNYKRPHWLPMVLNLGPGGLLDPEQSTQRRQL